MTVIYEDNHIIIVNKTASEIVQGDKTGDKPLSEIVKEYIKEKYKPGAISVNPGPNATVARLVLAHGGVTQFANPGKVQIQRTAPDGSKKTLLVDVGRILKEGTFEDDVPVQDADVVIVPEKGLLGL